MTQNEIIEMARQAGLFTHKEVQAEIKAFAKLVEAKEREACAKTCVELPAALEEYGALNRAAAAIRARGEA